MDGTFKFCPKYFSQLYILVAEKNGWYIAVVSALLPDKMETTYNRLFRTLKQLVPNFPPKIMIDFEKAVMNSIKTNFPNCAISCCRFHLGQAWWRKIQNLGLTELFRDRSSEEGSWLRSFFGLPCVDAASVSDVFVDVLMADAPVNHPQCMEFSDYVLETYILGSFTPEMWASDQLFCRTNNATERNNRHYNEQFYSPSPNIFAFLEVLLQEDIGNVLKVRSSGVQAPIRAEERRRRDRLENIKRENQDDIKSFLKAIKNEFLPLWFTVWFFYKYFTCNFGNRILSVIEIFYAAWLSLLNKCIDDFLTDSFQWTR